MFLEVTLIGNLGGDPEMRFTPQGQGVTNFSVATNRKWSNDAGEQQQETIWFRVTVWGKMAEVCNQYLSKGRQVFIQGRLRPDPATGGPRIWHTQDGETRASFEITAHNVKFLGSRNGDAPQSPSSEGAIFDGDDEDIPF
jgi:single-strand DNA-binding protein